MYKFKVAMKSVNISRFGECTRSVCMCCEVRYLMRSEPRADEPKLDIGGIIRHMLLGSRGWEGREKIAQDVGGEGNVSAESSSEIVGHKQGLVPQKQEKELSRKKIFADLRGSGSGS